MISPATVVVCGSPPPGSPLPPSRPNTPVTWTVGLDALLRRHRDVDGSNLALEIDPAWLTSRKALRAALVQARHAAPGLEAGVLRGVPLAHQGLLAEEGIRVVLVDAFGPVAQGSRRPAPSGWPCRTVAWGLWEVRACPPRRSRGWAWLPGLPAPRRGGLHVACAEGSGLQRLLDWVDRSRARGSAGGVTLGQLPAILEGRRPAALAASVLKAA